MSVYFEARYDGRCAGCHVRFDKGDQITISNGFTYAECCREALKEGIFENVPAAIEPLRAGETVCDRCFTVRPCFC